LDDNLIDQYELASIWFNFGKTGLFHSRISSIPRSYPFI